MNKEVKLGIYKHFKGHLCRIVGVAKYTEDSAQEFVVYQYPHKGDNIQLWIRPKEMFLESVERDGYKGPRFEFIGE